MGQAALSLHLAMRGAHGERHTADGIRSEAPNSDLRAPRSILLSTRAADFDRTWPDVIQEVRKGPAKAYFAPELKRLAAEAKKRRKVA